ncbi:PP2C family protein-serine/threonine phosphatase [Jiangella asiatica]|uniref:Serine/threonine protein phosphatase PstP n=1 Tax=Jiangella asiatica TaxID=2530372 RepID=A0A4R5C4I3_9ACTN|nr:PP2C family serine/threonine-protein phosphatase [Jiangella asiatica]TDD94528.1 serine/threonine-protein phosphatase [Jiangella asiatica]
MSLTLRYVARTDVGLLREGNEDSGYAGPYLLAVADGMGGHAAGEVASKAAIDELLRADQPPAHADANPLDVLAAAVTAANDRINELAIADPARAGMGTTSTSMLWDGSRLALAHIGDSRAYLLRGGVLAQITRDHTFVQSLVDDGRITAEDAREHPARSVVTKVLQGQSPIQPDFSLVDVQPGDRFLICSDGLSDVVGDPDIQQVMAAAGSIEEAADRLIALALDSGAPDNVTVVLGEVVPSDDDHPAPGSSQAFMVGAVAEPSPDGGTPDDPETVRYAPQPPRRRPWLRPALAIGVLVAVGWAGLTIANDWVREQYYIGSSGGQVAVYQGVSQELGPIHLSELHQIPGDLPVDALPEVFQDQVGATISADDLDTAVQVVESLRREACQAQQGRGATGGSVSTEDAGFPGLRCADSGR